MKASQTIIKSLRNLTLAVTLAGSVQAFGFDEFSVKLIPAPGRAPSSVTTPASTSAEAVLGSSASDLQHESVYVAPEDDGYLTAGLLPPIEIELEPAD